ncbi:hypothetical protein Tco_1199037 [Tanacetum coccineum]
MEEHIIRERKIQRYYEADSKRKKEYGKTVAAYNKERVTRHCQDRIRSSWTTQNVDKESSLASRVFGLFKFVNDSHALISLTALGTHLSICWGKRKINAKAENVKELDGKLKGICMQKGGRQPTGMVSPMAKAGGFTSVSDMIHAEGTNSTENDPPTSSESKSVSEKIAFIRAVCNNKEEKGRLMKQ